MGAVYMAAFCGFGAPPFRQHGSLFARACSLLVPLRIAPHLAAGRLGDVGPEVISRLWAAFSGRACSTGPVLRPSRRVS